METAGSRAVEKEKDFLQETGWERVIRECLHLISSDADPEAAIHRILEDVGEICICDRVYVFEFENSMTHNTYEWCREGVTFQKNILQNVPQKWIDLWIESFRKDQEVVLSDIEDIRTENPALFAVLKPQSIQSLVAVPLMNQGRPVGFLGVDNPDPTELYRIAPLLKQISCYILSLLRYRDLLDAMEQTCSRDSLTGAYNRSQLFRYCEQIRPEGSAALIHCRVMGLKESNVLQGSENGDRLLRDCYGFIRLTLGTRSVYRVSGDEFSVLFLNMTELEFMKKVRDFENQTLASGLPLVVGYTWSGRMPDHIDEMLFRADRVIREKAHCLEKQDGDADSEWRRQDRPVREGLFYEFLDHTYYDLEMIFQSMSQDNTTSYFFFGDMQKNVFYISDNLRDDFGFQSNIVSEFPEAWECRILSDKARSIYRKDYQEMLREKKEIHDLRYQVKDIDGNCIWIHCYGIVKWDREKTRPLFFSGRITHQDREFVVDALTNFPCTSVMLNRLNEWEGARVIRAIGFSLNNITEINNTMGRAYADHLVQTVAEELFNKLASKMSFYRLDGMRYIAILDPSCHDEKEKVIRQIREIVSYWYKIKGISVCRTCSFAYMDYQKGEASPADFLEQMVLLIKVAKHDSSSEYVEYSGDNIAKVKHMSKISLTLSHDVLHEMKQFRIVIQPIVSCRDQKIIGGEVLLRWNFEGRDVSPSTFIPVLEKDKMICPAGRWVFEQAVCTLMRMLSYQKDISLTFNVSMYQLDDPGLPDFMEEILDKYHMDGTHLIAEMTENFMDEQPEKMYEFVSRCEGLGIRTALDDFGNGYSSLRRLLQYPSNIIKLDRSLMCEMMESEEKKNFISSIVYACHKFGKKVCMEGVETSEQECLIRETGCDLIQGYYYYRPVEVEEMYRLLSLS